MSDSTEQKTEVAEPKQVTEEGQAQEAPQSAEAIVADELAEAMLRIELDQFEGPFEVLLYLIRAQEIDIFDIPIVKITEQYLNLIERMKDESIEIAGEFIVMAATLIQIKSRMILPVEVDEDDDEEIEEEDPRLELVEKLLEYRKFKDISEALDSRWDEASNWYPRNVKPRVMDTDDEDEELEVDLQDLILAIRGMLRFMGDEAIHEVITEGSSIDEKIDRIESILADKETLTWAELLAESRNKVEVVCCFLAILELCRMHRIRAHQHHPFEDIRLFPRTAEEIAAYQAAIAADMAGQPEDDVPSEEEALAAQE